MQVQQVIIAQDDATINALLDKTFKWSNETRKISDFFDTSVPDTLRNRVLGDNCCTIEASFNQTLNVLAAKACRIEQAISKLPSLEVIDEFVMTVCGSYCHIQCSRGFPYMILDKWVDCLEDPMGNPFTLPFADASVQVNN